MQVEPRSHAARCPIHSLSMKRAVAHCDSAHYFRHSRCFLSFSCKVDSKPHSVLDRLPTLQLLQGSVQATLVLVEVEKQKGSSMAQLRQVKNQPKKLDKTRQHYIGTLAWTNLSGQVRAARWAPAALLSCRRLWGNGVEVAAQAASKFNQVVSSQPGLALLESCRLEFGKISSNYLYLACYNVASLPQCKEVLN